MLTLAHLSDVHLGPLPEHADVRLSLKQRAGRRNWRHGRATSFDEAVLAALVRDIAGSGVDHTAVTGDLINIGLEAEVTRALAWLQALGPPDRVSLVPGNHDAYVRLSHDAHMKLWADYMSGDNSTAGGVISFPYVRRLQDVALVGVSTAVPTPLLMATGRIGSEQLRKIETGLTETGADGLFRVLLIHHPPDTRSTPWHKRLIDASALRTVLRRCGVELILHGHNHVNRTSTIPRSGGDIPVVGVAAASLRPRKDRPGGAWNRIQITPGAEPHVQVSVRACTESGDVVEVDRIDFRS